MGILLRLLSYINAIVRIYEYKIIGAFGNRDNQCGIVFENNKENKPQIDALNHTDHCFVIEQSRIASVKCYVFI